MSTLETIVSESDPGSVTPMTPATPAPARRGSVEGRRNSADQVFGTNVFGKFSAFEPLTEKSREADEDEDASKEQESQDVEDPDEV